MTKKITLFYQLTPTTVVPPAIREVQRKDQWIRNLQQTIEADWKPLLVKLTYELFNPEVEKQIRFFNGTCVKYYAIQNMDMLVGVPDSKTLKIYREEILDEMLGYDLHLVHRTIRQRKSTTDFKSVEAWNKFLNLLQETLFDSAGYIFPDSKEFWELVEEHGHEEAERISIENLQRILKAKQTNGSRHRNI